MSDPDVGLLRQTLIAQNAIVDFDNVSTTVVET